MRPEVAGIIVVSLLLAITALAIGVLGLALLQQFNEERKRKFVDGTDVEMAVMHTEYASYSPRRGFQ